MFSGTIATVVTPYFSKPAIRHSSSVDLLDVEPKKKSQAEREEQLFTQNVKVPESFKIKKDVKRNFLSEEEVTVLEQTVAKKTDAVSENRDEHARGEQAGQKGSARDLAVGELQKFAHGDAAVNTKAKDGAETKPLKLPILSGSQFDRGESTFAFGAPNIKVGKMTALNTDRFVYYGFYQRAGERIYPQWENFVRAAIYTYQNTHRVFGSKEFKSRYEILLQPDGTYEKAILRESSGLNSVDLALAQAFRKAAKIPHPPQEMVQEDGFIHMVYETVVEVGPNQLADAE